MSRPLARNTTAYINGNIVTVDPQFTIAQAFSVANDRIFAVGSNPEITARAGLESTDVDLQGRTVTPGLIDTRAYAIFRGLFAAVQPSLVAFDQSAQLWRASAKQRESNPLENGSRVHRSESRRIRLLESLDEKRWPTSWDLDSAVANHPVYIPTRVAWPHPAIFNSAGLARLGITRETPDEPSVKIGHPSHARLYPSRRQ